MKPITHARKATLLQYFDVLETQLRLALQEAGAARPGADDAVFIDAVVARVQERLAAGATPEQAPPGPPQIRKQLQNVLDPAFLPEAGGDPLRAVYLLREQLRGQAEFTPPPGGLWRRDRDRSRGPRRR